MNLELSLEKISLLTSQAAQAESCFSFGVVSATKEKKQHRSFNSLKWPQIPFKLHIKDKDSHTLRKVHFLF